MYINIISVPRAPSNADPASKAMQTGSGWVVCEASRTKCQIPCHCQPQGQRPRQVYHWVGLKINCIPDRYHLPPPLAAYSLGTTLVGPTSVVTQASVSREEELQSVSLSVMSNSATLWIVALQAPLSMGFSRQEYWNGLPLPSPRDLPNPGLNPGLLHGRQIIYSLSQQGSPKNYKNLLQITQI